MKEMKLKDVQNISLEILDNFHKFCASNDIKYSLGYGTLIGAIRHHGFIPWDDDIDVIMLRKDFNRFCELYKDSENYKLFSYQRKNMYAVCARLCEMKRTYVKTYAPLYTEEAGVWIDIFPIDIVDNNKETFLKNLDSIIKADYDTKMKRISMLPLKSQINNVRDLIYYLKNKILLYHSVDYYLSKQISLISKFSRKEGEMTCQLGFPDNGDRDYLPISLYNDYIEVDFEGHRYYAISKYDILLKSLYGNYMELPPIEEQKRGHTHHDYYWKS